VVENGKEQRLIKITDRTLDVVFSRSRGFSFRITITKQLGIVGVEKALAVL